MKYANYLPHIIKQATCGKISTIAVYINIFYRSSLYVCMVNIKLKYNFVETPRKFTIAKLSIRKLGSALLLALMKIRAYESKALR